VVAYYACGEKGAVEIIFRQDMNDPQKIAEKTKEYEDRFLSPFVAAQRGYIDDVIMPHSTRRRIARALAVLRHKQLENPGRNTTIFRCKGRRRESWSAACAAIAPTPYSSNMSRNVASVSVRTARETVPSCLTSRCLSTART
jgi:hypothetical protein